MKVKLIKLALHDGYRLDDENGLLIASTLESSKNKLSLKNCQAIERGYDLDELARTIFPDKIFTTNEEYEIHIDGSPYQWGFKVGFQKALELMGDKRFSRDDMIRASDWYVDTKGKKSIDELIESLQQTEWDVEVDMDAIPADRAPGGWDRFPKLDADGCLILKLKSK